MIEKKWSGRPDSNRRRPAWENATTLILKDLANYCAHRVQWSFPSFQDLGANGITTESQNSAPHPKTTMPLRILYRGSCAGSLVLIACCAR
jgi:hypothetical protein